MKKNNLLLGISVSIFSFALPSYALMPVAVPEACKFIQPTPENPTIEEIAAKYEGDDLNAEVLRIRGISKVQLESSWDDIIEIWEKGTKVWDLVKDIEKYGLEPFIGDPFVFQFNGVVYGAEVPNHSDTVKYRDLIEHINELNKSHAEVPDFQPLDRPYYDPKKDPDLKVSSQLKEVVKTLLDWYGDSNLKLSGPTHVLKGESYKFKTELSRAEAGIRYSTDQIGYVGTDRVDWEHNSYLNIPFKNISGPVLVWAERKDKCTAMSVWAQDRPTVNVVQNWPQTNRYTLTYTVDKSSYAAQLDGGLVKIRFNQMGPGGHSVSKYFDTFATASKPKPLAPKYLYGSSEIYIVGSEIEYQDFSDTFVAVVKDIELPSFIDDNSRINVEIDDGKFKGQHSFHYTRQLPDLRPKFPMRIQWNTNDTGMSCGDSELLVTGDSFEQRETYTPFDGVYGSYEETLYLPEGRYSVEVTSECEDGYGGYAEPVTVYSNTVTAG